MKPFLSLFIFQISILRTLKVVIFVNSETQTMKHEYYNVGASFNLIGVLHLSTLYVPFIPYENLTKNVEKKKTARTNI